MNEAMINLIRLVNGEDIIGEIVEIDEELGAIYVKDPHRIVYIPGKNPGTVNVSLIEWILPEITNEDVININVSQIITVVPVKTEIVDYYLKAVETIKEFRSRKPEIVKKGNPKFQESSVDSDMVDDLSGIGDLDYIKEMLEEIQKKNRKDTLH